MKHVALAELCEGTVWYKNERQRIMREADNKDRYA